MSKIHVVTSTGFECDVNSKTVKDYRFAKMMRNFLSEEETDQLKSMIDLVGFTLGEDGEERIMNHVMDDEGFVDSELVGKEVTEILTALQNDSGVKN